MSCPDDCFFTSVEFKVFFSRYPSGQIVHSSFSDNIIGILLLNRIKNWTQKSWKSFLLFLDIYPLYSLLGVLKSVWICWLLLCMKCWNITLAVKNECMKKSNSWSLGHITSSVIGSYIKKKNIFYVLKKHDANLSVFVFVCSEIFGM